MVYPIAAFGGVGANFDGVMVAYEKTDLVEVQPQSINVNIPAGQSLIVRQEFPESWIWEQINKYDILTRLNYKCN